MIRGLAVFGETVEGGGYVEKKESAGNGQEN